MNRVRLYKEKAHFHSMLNHGRLNKEKEHFILYLIMAGYIKRRDISFYTEPWWVI